MSPAPAFYELSTIAEKDIEDIFDFTLKMFGLEQAAKYTLEFEVLFEELTQTPYLGRERNEIKTGLRSFPKESHIIFYRVLGDRIRIVRILHQRKDIQSFSE